MVIRLLTKSILNSTKKLLGLPEDYDAFDTDVIIHINSVFSTLYQLGVGNHEAFSITGPEETWEQFTEDSLNLNNVRTYVYLRVRLLFDPPPHAFMLSAVQEQIKELEWRLSVQGEKERSNQNGIETFRY